MSDLSRAIEIMRQADSGLRELMSQSLQQQRYKDLGEVAPIADHLAEILRRVESGGGVVAVVAPARTDASPPLGVRISPAKASYRTKDEYPRFERDGDKLVKIGWSKKDRREYEHRVPRLVVQKVAERLATAVRPGSVFSMDKLIPFKDDGGNDIPSYQAYLALAWFRDLGLIEQRGKEGYTVLGGVLSSQRVETAWDQAQIRK